MLSKLFLLMYFLVFLPAFSGLAEIILYLGKNQDSNYMKRKVLVSTLLIIVALIFVFLTAKSILRPKKFSDVYTARREMNINRLTAIAELQKLYKKENGEYAAKIEDLEDFYMNGHFTVTSTRRTSDTIPEGLSMEEAEKQGYYETVEIKVPIKEKIEETLAEINKKREFGDHVVMENFQYIPYSDNQKYKIEICTTDSTVQKFAIYVPVDVILNDLQKSTISEEKGFISRGIGRIFYGGLENDMRERRECVGVQLGDTVKPSIEVVDYGKTAE